MYYLGANSDINDKDENENLNIQNRISSQFNFILLKRIHKNVDFSELTIIQYKSHSKNV